MVLVQMLIATDQSQQRRNQLLLDDTGGISAFKGGDAESSDSKQGSDAEHDASATKSSSGGKWCSRR